MVVWLLAASAWAGVLDKGDCVLCHVVAGEPVAEMDVGCQSCHQWVRAVSQDSAKRAQAMAVFPLWERYERTVHSYIATPDLAAASRLDPAWVADWLADPHDVRPRLDEGMPRFGLSASERREVAGFLVASRPEIPSTVAPSADRVARGAVVFTEAGCPSCHTFGSAHTSGVLPLAPDLIHTRDRMKPDVVSAWMASPTSFSKDATMPAVDLSPDDLLAVRDYILLADVSAPEAPPPSELGTSGAKDVVWADVEERVFGRICVHCHMDPAQNGGRRGPGNAGGFGWAATGLELQTYDSVKRHEPAIVAAMMRRRDEAARDHVAPGQRPAALKRPSAPGMPLGLPAIDDADLQLVLAWYAQGAPRE